MSNLGKYHKWNKTSRQDSRQIEGKTKAMQFPCWPHIGMLVLDLETILVICNPFNPLICVMIQAKRSLKGDWLKAVVSYIWYFIFMAQLLRSGFDFQTKWRRDSARIRFS